MEKNMNSIQFPLRVLGGMGLYSDKHVRKTFMVSIIYMVLVTFLLTMELIRLFNMNGDVSGFTRIVESVSAYCNFLSKLIVLLIQRKTISNLTACIAQGWKTDLCPKEIKHNLDGILRRNLRLQRIFFFSVAIGLAALMLSSLYARHLPLGDCNKQMGGVLYGFIIAVQTFFVPCVTLAEYVFLCIFMACCAEIIVQSRILCYRFQQFGKAKLPVGIGHGEGDLVPLVEHHVYVLRFLKTLQDTFSPIVTVDYATQMLIICTQMYAFFESNQIGSSLKHAEICITTIVGLAIYCIPANYAASEAEEVAHAAYQATWYLKHSPWMRNSLTIIIQRANHEHTFIAGGLFQINSRAVLTALKLSWTICTVMQAMKHNSH